MAIHIKANFAVITSCANVVNFLQNINAKVIVRFALRDSLNVPIEVSSESADDIVKFKYKHLSFIFLCYC